jgi:YegS/Rv2252/BmrU family lipid kinase
MMRLPPHQSARIYAVGGDGILFDCLNGIADFRNAELTAIPYGSSNDYVRSFGPKAIDEFRNLEKLIDAPSRPVDIIDCGSNYAMNCTAIGIESQAALNANSIFRNPRLKFLHNNAGLVFNLAALSAIVNEEVRRQDYQVIMDDEDLSGCYGNIAIANTPCMGGTMYSSPYAKADDGLLDAIFAAGLEMLAAVRSVSDYTKGRFESNKTLSYRKFRKMEIKSELPIRVHLDGESFFTDKLKLEVLPGRIRFFAPAGLEFEDYSYIGKAKNGEKARHNNKK